MKKNKFAKDISFAETQSVNFDQTILARPSQIKWTPFEEKMLPQNQWSYKTFRIWMFLYRTLGERQFLKFFVSSL